MMRTVALTGLIWTSVLCGTVVAGDAATRTTLEAVKGCPESYSKVPFDIDLLYGGTSDVFNPFYTLFEPATYVNFKAWSSTTPVWTRDGYTNPHHLFYVGRKNESTLRAMLEMDKMTWFKARCIVRGTFSDRAWIEVLDIVSEGRQMTRDDMRSLVRGWVHNERGEYHRAVLQFDEVDTKGLPDEFESRLLVEQGKAHLGSGDAERAVSYFRQARSMDSDFAMASEMYAMADAYHQALKRGEVALNPLLRPARIVEAPTTTDEEQAAESTTATEVQTTATEPVPPTTEAASDETVEVATEETAEETEVPPTIEVTAEDATATETVDEQGETWPDAVEITTEFPDEAMGSDPATEKTGDATEDTAEQAADPEASMESADENTSGEATIDDSSTADAMEVSTEKTGDADSSADETVELIETVEIADESAGSEGATGKQAPPAGTEEQVVEKASDKVTPVPDPVQPPAADEKKDEGSKGGDTQDAPPVKDTPPPAQPPKGDDANKDQKEDNT